MTLHFIKMLKGFTCVFNICKRNISSQTSNLDFNRNFHNIRLPVKEYGSVLNKCET